ncbi:hypothetical protein T069G_07725 [Trichoderma breve]|uniref:Uncharacterized protein n=1 Tax=Trichoderma breve TaxID=2034170 RepID=A0A9W9BBD1_9HYPO|nr:hypothetical protein T069G_07725 [Trichoderma breve]KAJ4856828.1 hypothetical protein T069G_07725 [Trichoderma breve]
MFLPATFAFLILFGLGIAVPEPRLLDPVRMVFQFPPNTFLENLAVRSNGEILTTLLNDPQLFVIDPDLETGAPLPVLVHEFTDSLGLAGIAEYEPDIFAVISGRFNIPTGDVGPGSWNVWSVNMNGVSVQGNVLSGSPNLSLIANVASANFLNGMTLLSQSEGTFLLSDVNAGVVYRLDTQGNYEVVINSTLTSSVPFPPVSRTGVDGLHVHHDRDLKTLYFANAGQQVLAKVAINDDGTPAGDIEIVARPLNPIDTYAYFTLDCDGNIFLVTGSGNGVERISMNGQRSIIAGNVNSTAIAEPTSAAFGRGSNDKNILYVSTIGGMEVPVDGNITIGAQLVAVTTSSQGSAACALYL